MTYIPGSLLREPNEGGCSGCPLAGLCGDAELPRRCDADNLDPADLDPADVDPDEPTPGDAGC